MAHNIIYGQTIDIHGDSLKIGAPLSFASETDFNVFIGLGAGEQMLKTTEPGGDNVAIGSGALNNSTSANWGVFLGRNAGQQFTDATGATMVGAASGQLATVAPNSTFIGYESGSNVTTSVGNTFLGEGSGTACTTGTGLNLCCGKDAGSVAPTTGTNCILLNHIGVAADTNVTRIGTGTAKTFIAGIAGVTTDAAAVACLVSGTGQLGVTSCNEDKKKDFGELDTDVVKEMLHMTPVREYYYKTGHQAMNVGPNVEDLEKLEAWKQYFPDFIARDENGTPMAFATQHLPWLMLHDMQRIQRELDALKNVPSDFKPDYDMERLRKAPALKRAREEEEGVSQKKVRFQ